MYISTAVLIFVFQAFTLLLKIGKFSVKFNNFKKAVSVTCFSKIYTSVKASFVNAHGFPKKFCLRFEDKVTNDFIDLHAPEQLQYGKLNELFVIENSDYHIPRSFEWSDHSE